MSNTFYVYCVVKCHLDVAKTDPHRKFACGMPDVIYVRKTKQASPINSTLKDNHFNKLIVHFSRERPSVYHFVDLFYLLLGLNEGRGTAD